MSKEIYTIRASKYNDGDPVRGVSSGMEYTDRYVVLAESEGQAAEKFLEYLGNHTRSRRWEVDSLNLLKKGEGLTLEKRLEVLKEVMPVAE